MADKPSLESIKKLPFNKFPIIAKKIAVKEMSEDLQIGSREIARLLGIGKSRVYDYLKEKDFEAPNEWDGFRTLIKKMFEHKSDYLRAKVLSHLDEMLPEAKFYDTVGLLKTLQDAQREDNRVAIQSQQTVVFQVTKDNK